MKTLQTLMIFLIFFVTVLNISGCGEPKKPKDNRQEIRFWHFWEPKLIAPAIEEFERDNPQWKVNATQLTWANGLEKITVSLAAGNPPDLCELGSTWTSRFMYEGVLQDLTEKVQDIREKLLIWEPVTMNDDGENRFFGLPWLVGTRAIFYNKELFRKAGLDEDKLPENWMGLLNAAKAISKLGDGIYGFGINAGERHVLYKKILPFMWGNYGDILDENGKNVVFSMANLEAINMYMSFASYGLKEKQEALDSAFKDGKLGIMCSGSWNLTKIPKDAPKLEFGVGLMPKPRDNYGVPASFAGAEMLVIFSASKKQEMALALAKKLILPENAMKITRETMTVMPAHKDCAQLPEIKDNPGLMVFAEQMKYSKHPPIHPKWIEMQDELDSAFEGMLLGMPPRAALKKAHDGIEKVLKLEEK